MWGLGKSAWPNWEWVDEGLKALTGFHHRVLYRPEGPYILPLRIDLLPKRALKTAHRLPESREASQSKGSI